MKCQNCGADIDVGERKCQYCGASIDSQMLREQEILHKQGCPKCGSTNITFERETQSKRKSKKGTDIIISTVGLCKDCGYTWQTATTEPKKKKKTWLWVLGWIVIFPIPLTLIMLKKKNMKPALKYGIIAAGWLIYLLIALLGGSGSSDVEAPKDNVPSQNIVIDQNEEQEIKIQPEDNKVDDTQTEEQENLDEPEEEIDVPEQEQKEKEEQGNAFEELKQSLSQLNAVGRATEYLKLMPFSRKGLIAQLEFEGFPNEDAVYAVDYLEIDWNEQAAKKAQDYLDLMSFSRSSLINQLEFDGFTPSEAEYGVSAVGY